MDFKKLEMSSASHSDSTLEALRELVPGAFTETREPNGALTYRVDWDMLRELLGDTIRESDEETYGFLWVGKQEAKRAAAKPTRQTLRPVPEDSVDWDTTKNLYIEGDNLEVLKLLQRAYLGRVKMIYIDPPYNTGKEFVYEDNYTMSREEEDKLMGNIDEENRRLRSNPETESRYHSDWCSMIYSRLLVARTLLANDGVIFISIDDNEVHHLRCICDEVFGASNFVGQWNWFKSATPPNLSKKIKKNIEYILAYQKGGNDERFGGVKKESKSDDPSTKPQNSLKTWTFPSKTLRCKLPDGIIHKGVYGTDKFPNELLNDLIVQDETNLNEVSFKNRFIWLQDTLNEQLKNETVVSLSKQLVLSYKKAEYKAEVPPNFIDMAVGVDTTEQAGSDLDVLLNRKVFDYPKPVSLIKYLASFLTENNDIVLDFFSGSATTAHAVMQLNAEDGGHRKYIMVQLREETPEGSEARRAGYDTICEIGKERIRCAGRKILKEYALQADELDTGFRVLSLDSSNMEDVYFEPSEVTRDKLFELEEKDLVKPGRTELDLLFGCMVDWGVQLSYPMRTEEVEGKRFYVVNEGELVACFDRDITLETIRHIAELVPERVIFRESCFTTDADKLNVYELFKQQCGWSEEEVYRNVYVL